MLVEIFTRAVESLDGFHLDNNKITASNKFKGRLSPTGESDGHYTCDIKENISNMWFKTNDSRNPIQISVSDVSKHGYVVLFKRA